MKTPKTPRTLEECLDVVRAWSLNKAVPEELIGPLQRVIEAAEQQTEADNNYFDEF